MNNRFSRMSRTWIYILFLCPALSVKAQMLPDSLPPIDSLNDWAVNELAQGLAAKAQSITQFLTEKAQKAGANCCELESSIAEMKLDSLTPKSHLDSLNALLKLARTLEKKALKDQKQAEKTSEQAFKTAGADNLYQRKNLSKTWKSVEALQNLAYPPEPKEEPQPAQPVAEANEPVEPPKPPAPLKTKKTDLRYDPKQDVMLNPPLLPCDFEVQTKDELSGEMFRQTKFVELFRHTPPALKTYLEGKSNIRCEAALSASGSNYQLLLNFIIFDPSPRKAFGKLEKNSPATCWFIDGTWLTLSNSILDEGKQNPEDQSFVFKAYYPLTIENFKRLQKTELDKIRITWASGYEDYDVHYIQLIQQLARCF
ncbi:MAG: hypothetical protein JNJ57_17915 [Saprospiraceae bacterium]|nr:hypothetical protein [Saprospiraceae bacterium]